MLDGRFQARSRRPVMIGMGAKQTSMRQILYVR
jgi:hypothetical protein